MKSLIEVFAQPSKRCNIEQLIIPRFDPVQIKLCSSQGEIIKLHYFEHSNEFGQKGFSLCAGQINGCLACCEGYIVKDHFVMAVYDVNSEQVKALRMSLNRDPDGLGNKLRGVIQKQKINQNIITVKRDGDYNFKVTVAEEPESEFVGTDVIDSFMGRYKEGMLKEVFPT